MLIIAPSGMLLWLFSVFCSGSRLSDWFMQCSFTENFLDVFVWGHYICSTLVMFNIGCATCCICVGRSDGLLTQRPLYLIMWRRRLTLWLGSLWLFVSTICCRVVTVVMFVMF